MKQEKYILLVSLVILIACIFFFVFSDTPTKSINTSVASSSTEQGTVTGFGVIATSINASGTKPEPDSKFNTALWSAVYTSTAYGFSLSFPESWSTYKAKEVKNGVDFGVEDQDIVFSIKVYSTSDWNKQILESKSSGKVLPTALGKTSSRVFVVERAQDFTDKVMSCIIVYPSILTTFKVLDK